MIKRIKYRVPTTHKCQSCLRYGFPEDDEVCPMCQYSGKEIRRKIAERQLVNRLIESYNKGDIQYEGLT